MKSVSRSGAAGLLSLAVVAAGIAGALWSLASASAQTAPKPVQPSANGDTASGPFAFPITTVRVEQTPMADTVRIAGKVVPAPLGEARVTSPAAGVVQYPPNPPRIGQTVHKGDTLATFIYVFELHDAVHLLNLRWPILQALLNAQRDQVQAHVDLERAQTLGAASAGSPYERVHELVGPEAVGRAEARWHAAQAEVDMWMKRLELHEKQIQTTEPTRQPIIAPINGVLAESHFTQGQRVHEADLLFTVANLSEVWVEGAASVSDAEPIRRVDVASVVVPGDTIAPRAAKRQAIVPLVEGETRMMRLQYSLPNPDGLLRFNMSVDLLIEHGQRAPALTVPRAAVLTREQRSYVFVRVGPDSYARREVRLRGQNARVVAVDRLSAGDEVVVGGNQKLWSILEEGNGPVVAAHVH